MNKLKEAIRDLRNYLGADRKGVALLEEVTEIANDQRKRAAAMEESTASAKATAKSLRDKLDEAELQITALKAELNQQAALCAAAQLRERTAAAALEQLTDANELEPMMVGDRITRVRTLFRNIQKRFKHMPGRVGNQKDATIYLEDFVKNYSYDEFAGLGMVLAACCLTQYPVRTVTAEAPLLAVEKRKGAVNWVLSEKDKTKVLEDLRKFAAWTRYAFTCADKEPVSRDCEELFGCFDLFATPVVKDKSVAEEPA